MSSKGLDYSLDSLFQLMHLSVLVILEDPGLTSRGNMELFCCQVKLPDRIWKYLEGKGTHRDTCANPGFGEDGPDVVK